MGAWARKLARDIDVLGAVTMAALGGRPHRKVRRKAHVKRALAKVAKPKAKEVTE